MWKRLALGAAALVVLTLAAEVGLAVHQGKSNWLRLTSPGPLSAAHAFIGDNCTACHTTVAGVTREKCVVCHANENELVDRQPTAFHAAVSQCAPCHYEHVRGVQRPIQMDHSALVRIGLADLGSGAEPERQHLARLLKLIRSESGVPSNPSIGSEEKLLNCVSCHQVQDVHKGNFGKNCALCHATKTWFIADYVHPAPSTRQCVQCHTPSPCHFMEGCLGMMGEMAGGHGARLGQCYLCHKTTSWYDFRRATSRHH